MISVGALEKGAAYCCIGAAAFLGSGLAAFLGSGAAAFLGSGLAASLDNGRVGADLNAFLSATRLFANKLRALSIFAWISRGTGR